ncbi:hypothetical protein HYDPIDRAFT_113204 [Hydnomerulius pinastri MD-312]|uniref:Uncharacterized protein n=1 Tax=Hydnomerulius pinastri MD-312 TaxID=994086 RepID=A0A0C9W6M6_9AGAM|nr:hypothetical protein HYDPIDRAFT_119533 [Hydnomerulius pinastri MD-312]KIJ63692.1 hypothetical protein HYDPIDRAFT_113204 [Hydnomerulius pinastri MD-312]
MSTPSPTSLAHRAHIASIITPLRRVRPKVPFYDLAAHRIPTLWSLYRELLRHAERDNIKWRIGTLFRQNRHTIQAHVAKEQLVQGHRWLDIFIRAKEGDTRLRAVLDRYERMIQAKCEKEHFREVVRETIASHPLLRPRTLFKGSFIRPTYYNKLLPRLSPQPPGISGMIHRRRVARDRRYALKEVLEGWMDDLKKECAFEATLLGKRGRSGTGAGTEGKNRVFSDNPGAWQYPLALKHQSLQATFTRDYARLKSPYPPALLATAQRARRRLIQHRTRRRALERRGLLFPSTRARMRQGPPAHILARMTPEERKNDRIVRGPGEAGYTAQVKIKMGVRLREPGMWRLEDGREEEWGRFESMEEEVRRENERRRRNVAGEVGG